jgi:hypothetical protein
MSGGDHCWFKRSTWKKKPVTRDNDDDDNENNNNNDDDDDDDDDVIIIIIIIIIINNKLDKEHWYDHVPKSVETSHEGKVIILWNQQV